MNMIKMLEDMTKYLTEAFMRIFSRSEESLPDIGVQPFECAFYHQSKSSI